MSWTEVLKSSGSGLRPKRPRALWGHRLIKLVRERGLLVLIALTPSSAVDVVGGVTGWTVVWTMNSFYPTVIPVGGSANTQQGIKLGRSMASMEP